jgi:hypothetical protein
MALQKKALHEMAPIKLALQKKHPLFGIYSELFICVVDTTITALLSSKFVAKNINSFQRRAY